jgi:hypothetical protein
MTYQPYQHAPSAIPEPAPAPAAPAPRRSNRARIILTVVGGLAVFAGGWASGAAYTSQKATNSANDQHAEQVGRLQKAASTCDDGTGTKLADGGRTLTVDGKGSEDILNGLGAGGLDCVLSTLQMPEAVRQQLMQTRALDGRQQATWDAFTASWSYHPDDGINLIVQVQ